VAERAAGLKCAEPERRPSRRPFHELPNVLITPHSSSSSGATADRRWSVVAANLDRKGRAKPGLVAALLKDVKALAKGVRQARGTTKGLGRKVAAQ